jgi:isoleucyl-tRNA synthetase
VCPQQRARRGWTVVAQDFKQTMNLPQTEFPMRANLASREPEWLAYWDEIDIYKESLSARQGAEPFILHDGPPYANGLSLIHISEPTRPY